MKPYNFVAQVSLSDDWAFELSGVMPGNTEEEARKMIEKMIEELVTRSGIPSGNLLCLETEEGGKVFERAALKRLNRKLAHKGQKVRKNRAERFESDLGVYYCTDAQTTITARHIDLEDWCRREGVLKPYETIAARPA